MIAARGRKSQGLAYLGSTETGLEPGGPDPSSGQARAKLGHGIAAAFAIRCDAPRRASSSGVQLVDSPPASRYAGAARTAYGVAALHGPTAWGSVRDASTSGDARPPHR